VLQLSLATVASVPTAFFTNAVSATLYKSTDSLYVFGSDETKTRLEKIVSGAENIIKLSVYKVNDTLGMIAEFDTRGFLNLPQSDFERDTISYLAWMRTMI
jgi:hypothetical protein